MALSIARLALFATTSLLFVSCQCTEEKKPKAEPIKACADQGSGVAKCVRIVQRVDNTGSCQKPATETKPQAWFIDIKSDTPIDGELWNFTLKYDKEIYDTTGKLLHSQNIVFSKPSKKDLSDRKFLLGCRYAPASDTVSVPQYVTLKPTCIGFADKCDRIPFALVEKESVDQFSK
jgi:hypothetical protein